MSYFNPIVRYQPKIEEVDFIVPERIREACRYRGYTYKEAAKLCDIPEKEFGRMANGHKDIPDEYIFLLKIKEDK
ncbi:hypothetical protein SAMN02745883_00708 [Caminicella sporogenes DSM 14501]|uniref:XRE family transcriptional regulator n=1 Tax=Caminicella sporogenes DSM 14501 TaxID=1121266 RepID=A0A1M6MZ32_9FIRM|nr:helix-turn-helix transcriptional regulator [Caminicella sporogenes]RKD22440.1 hypothetical protein BET04_05250 [Caminicella sporogenes]SHJ88573.1 hypothetical protein SAMN02745883_00708 [Caminicella sporogenes DSM 14501]